MYKMCYDLHGVDKATYTMRKMFAKRKALEDGVEEPAPKKPAKKEPEPVKLINDSKLVTDRPSGKLLVRLTAQSCMYSWPPHTASPRLELRSVCAGGGHCRLGWCNLQQRRTRPASNVGY